MWRCITAALLVAMTTGCPSKPSSTPKDAAATTPPTPTPPPTPPTAPPTTTPTTTPPAPVVIRGDAYHFDRSRFTPPDIPDALTFHGWNQAGTIYAFEIKLAAEGADCSEEIHLFAVDATTDQFPSGGKVIIKHQTPEGGPRGCVPPDLAPVAARKRPAFLREHGIVAGNLRPPQRLNRDGGAYVAKTFDGGELRFTFEVRHRVMDPYGPGAERGAAYRLVLVTGSPDRVIEPGTRRRKGVIDYRMGEALLFESPQPGHFALILQKAVRAFEGARLSWMSNGFPRNP